MRERRYPRLNRAPEDTERHQVKRLFGDNAPARAAEMQRFCDGYGKTEAAE